MNSIQLRRRDIYWLIGILFVGLIIRLGIWTTTTDTGLLIVDEQHYALFAKNILAGNGFAWEEGRPTSIRPPLYPAFIAFTWWISGDQDPQSVRFVQILLSLGTVFLLYLIGKQVFSRKVALIGAGIFCFYPTYVGFSSYLYAEILFNFLLVLAALGYLSLITRGRWTLTTALATGLILGLAALTRTIAWPFFLALLPLVFFTIDQNYKKKFLIVTTMLMGFVLVIAPWSYRNTMVQKEFTLIDTMGGMNLMMGNYEYTPLNRAWDAVALITTTRGWAYEFNQKPEARGATEQQRANWASKQAKEFILEHPYLTFQRSVVKFFAFWGLERVIIAGWEQGLYNPDKWIIAVGSGIILVAYVSLMLLAAPGFFLALPDNKRFHYFVWLLVLVVTGIHTLVFGHSRYHFPLIPFFALYAAAAIESQAWKRLLDKNIASYAALFSIALLLFIWGREVFFVEGHRIETLLNRIL